MTNNIEKAFKAKSKLRGMTDGGKVKGKGGPTDDKVGPVMLSDGEYVLPADTVEIVGRENLDALRLATHDFVDEDNKPKVSGLRKMANGGTFYVDPEGVASRQLPPGRAVVPYQPPPQVIDVEPRNVSGAAAAAPPAATSSLRSAAGRGIAGLGGIYAVSDGVRSMANEGVTATNVGDTASGLTLLAQAAGRANPVAAAAGTGWAIGRVIGNNLSTDTQDAIGGTINNIVRGTGQTINKGLRTIGFDTDFGSNWGVDDSRYLESKASAGGAPAAQPQGAPAAPQSRSSEFSGMTNVPVGQQNLPPVTEDTRRSLLREGGGTPGQYVNLGSYGGDANIYGTASKPGGRIDSFVGVGASSRPGGSGPQEDPIMGEIRSALRGLTAGTNDRGGGGGSGNAREINARYDALLRAGSGRNIVRGLDWSQRHGLDLEEARARELGELARNQATLRGQDMEAATAANSDRMRALQTLGTMANQRSHQNAQAQAAMLKALQEARAAARQGEEKGFERYTDAISRMFIGPDGKPDAAEQERFTSFLQASDPQAYEKFTAMSPQDQMVLLQNFKTLYDMNKARNATAKRGGGAITNRADMPVDVREATWNDYWNNNLPLGDYIWSKLRVTNPNVVVTESGQPVLISDYATTDGNWDADKLELIRQRTGKDRHGRSALRGD